MRALRAPAKRKFWDEARAAAMKLPPDVRANLEPRDLAIIVAAAREKPELLGQTRDQLFRKFRFDWLTKRVADIQQALKDLARNFQKRRVDMRRK